MHCSAQEEAKRVMSRSQKSGQNFVWAKVLIESSDWDDRGAAGKLKLAAYQRYHNRRNPSVLSKVISETNF